MVRIPKTLKASAAKPTVPSEFAFNGTVDFKAGQAESSPKEFFITAYNGGKMRPAGFTHDVIVDLAECSFDKPKTIILENHETDRHSRIGFSTSQAIVKAGEFRDGLVGPTIALKGQTTGRTSAAKQFVEDATDGMPLQASIGAKILSATFIREGKTAEINGQTHNGPFVHAKKTVIREVSIVPLGADSTTETRLAAKAGSLILEDTQMNFAAWLKSLGLDEATLSAESKAELEATYTKSLAAQETPPPKKPAKGRKAADEIEANEDGSADDIVAASNAKFAENEDRLDRIRAIAGEFSEVETVKFGGKELKFSEFKKQAISKGMTADEFELHCRRADYPNMSTGPGIHIQSSNIDNDAMVAALCRSNGVVEDALNERTGQRYGLKHMFKEAVLEASHGKQYQIRNSIENLYEAQIRASGEHYTSFDRKSSDFDALTIKAWEKVRSRPVVPSTLNASGFSTLNLTYVLENAMYKTSLASFIAAEDVWRKFTKVRSLNDFKAHNFYRLDMTGAYKKVAADGELKHVSLTDAKYTMQAETFGAMICIDRKTRINDDLGVVMEQASDLGLLGAQRIAESIYVLLLSNPSSFYASGNANYATGAGSALSLTSLATARSAFRKQVVNSKPVNVAPKYILTGTALEIQANKIYGEANYEVPTATANAIVFTKNEFFNQYIPLVSPYIDNTSILDQDGAAITGQSATRWYLFADPNVPQGASMNIGFLNGRQTPYFDSAETQFNIPGGIQFRSYHDWGVKMMVTQLSYMADGA